MCNTPCTRQLPSYETSGPKRRNQIRVQYGCVSREYQKDQIYFRNASRLTSTNGYKIGHTLHARFLHVKISRFNLEPLPDYNNKNEISNRKSRTVTSEDTSRCLDVKRLYLILLIAQAPMQHQNVTTDNLNDSFRSSRTPYRGLKSPPLSSTWHPLTPKSIRDTANNTRVNISKKNL